MKNPRTAFPIVLILVACGRIAAADPVQREVLRPEQLEELVSPIALYPDPLVALILPAATRPSDIVLAARFLKDGGNPEKAATEPWDESVKALAHYPEVIAYLDENLAWTRSLGECFLDQPADVMNAIQRVRALARANGLLKDTNEQEIIVEQEVIRIVPASPTVVYVPRYDPEFLYVSSFRTYYPGPFLSFSLGYSVGAWLSYDCDWRHRYVRIVHRPSYWYRRPDWRGHLHHPIGVTTWRRWAPPPRHDRRFDRLSHHTGFVLHPGRPRNLSSQAHDFAPTPRRHVSNLPNPGPASFFSASPHGRVDGNQRRNNRTSPRRHSPATMDTPRPIQSPTAGLTAAQRPSIVYRHSSPQVSPPRVGSNAVTSLRHDHGRPPSVRPAQAYAPAAPGVTTPRSERHQSMMQSRPASSHSGGRDHSSRRQTSSTNEHRRR